MNDTIAAAITGTLSLVGLGWWAHDAWTVRHADRDLLAVADAAGVLRDGAR